MKNSKKLPEKKGKSQEAESWKLPLSCYILNHVAIIASRAQGVHLSEPLPYLVLSPLPVESSGIQWVMCPVRMC